MDGAIVSPPWGRSPLVWMRVKEAFLSDLLIYLSYPDKDKELIKLNEKERITILKFLERIIPLVKEKMEPYIMIETDLLPLIEQWKDFSNFNK